uniref:Uncharacterized protein LOC116942319 isoform X1 n=1 Tax=Petromyzon marinus TaxID=7757 RepID=A0AAJ7WU76_PETMA|nr:uncharacterized protein LOC116942319 isoform X1 [Petromyzon marinus]XP_032809968.1 uncharacterized protein LOC116942319 isoform X1 [Petromyzon marinus]XP_032809977.1 uncharacterized protein LOC116942319 isoform X1 [Petromyzon marinus]
MACMVTTPVLEPSGDFPAWLKAQGVNAEVAQAMDSELGIRDYGVLRACVGDGLVRAELLATARDRLPFGFYAVLRQVVKALQGAKPSDAGMLRWDDAAASSPGDVTLGGLVEVLLGLFSGLSRELLLSVQRLGDIDNTGMCAVGSPSANTVVFPENSVMNEIEDYKVNDEGEKNFIPDMGESQAVDASPLIKTEALEGAYSTMDTRSTVRGREPGQVDDPAEAGSARAGDGTWGDAGASTAIAAAGHAATVGGGLRDAHSRLAELLLAAASILQEITHTGGAGVGERGENRRKTTVPAINTAPQIEIGAISGVDSGGGRGRAHHVGGGTQPPLATSSPSDGHGRSQPGISAPEVVRPTEGATFALYESAVRDHHRQATEQTFQQQLSVLTAFTADAGDWGAFQRRFLAYQEMSGWSDDEALRALPATMDDDALATLVSAPRSRRSTLQAALQLMATVYWPPSVSRHHFHEWRKGAKEMPLAYRTALLALAKAAFPRMDCEGIDAMVTEKLLVLAQELGIVVLAADDADICSLRVAKNIHNHEVLKRNRPLITAASTSERSEPQDAQPSEEVFAATRLGDWRSGGRQPQYPARKLEQPRPSSALVTCYKCGLRGHVASGCRAPRLRAPGPRPDDAQASKSSQQSPASRGTTPARPSHTLHTTHRAAHDTSRATGASSVRGGAFGRALGPGQWSELAHRVVAASAGSSVVAGSIEGVEVRVLVDTGASATIISDLIYNILPVQC